MPKGSSVTLTAFGGKGKYITDKITMPAMAASRKNY